MGNCSIHEYINNTTAQKLRSLAALIKVLGLLLFYQVKESPLSNFIVLKQGQKVVSKLQSWGCLRLKVN